MQDKIEKIGNGSVIQHGSLNKRVYLMKLNQKDSRFIIPEINELARKNNYTKIFCKIPAWAAPLFFANGFLTEAEIPKFFNNEETAFFVSKFLSSDRLLGLETERMHEFSKMLVESDKYKKPKVIHDARFIIKKLNHSNCKRIAEIYREVFITYPFPIHKQDYILNSMDNGVQYFGAETEGRIVALASAEVDKESGNAELTDFATLPQHRGNNLSFIVLKEMEQEMSRQDIKTVYTIARMNSAAMNKTFLNMDFTYSGTLIKNTNIAGKIESMNVFYKHI